MIRRIVVLGSGLMAPGIAAACAAGASVAVAGRDPARVEAAARAAGSLAGAEVGAVEIAEESFAGTELVIETIVEDAAAKRELFARIEPWLAEDTVLATNTSSLSIAYLADGVARPERFAGFHFLNPAHLTAVVEVVPGPATAPETVDRLADLGRRMGKAPLVLLRDVPGFIWNRLQFAVLRECLHMLDEGVAEVESIDAAVADGLAPRWLAAGPLATVELGGPDTFRRAAEQLFPNLAAEVEVSGRLGKGFYRWTDEAREAVEALRAEALHAGREFSERRRASTP